MGPSPVSIFEELKWARAHLSIRETHFGKAGVVRVCGVVCAESALECRMTCQMTCFALCL